MRSHEVRLGRSFAVSFDDGDDFFTALDEFCRRHEVRQGYIPSFIAGMAEVDLVGTCDKLDDPRAPVWSKVRVDNVEAFGGGNIAWDEANQRVAPHVHVAVGLKAYSADARTSHLLGARVQFLTEMLIIEVSDPAMLRVPEAGMYDVPLLRVAERD